MSESGYGHEDVHSMHDIRHSCRHFSLGCVLVGLIIACALGWGVTLVGDYHNWALLTSSWDPPFRYKLGVGG